jgi:GGDEF domain-containing protein
MYLIPTASHQRSNDSREPAEPEEMVRSILARTEFVISFNDAPMDLQSKAAFDASRADATLDSATGLYNRRGLSLRVSELWADARRRREPITCLVISAHPPEVVAALELAEETALSMAQALRASVRGSDAVARLSPLDFAIMAPSLDRDAALRVLDRFHRHLAAAQGDGAIPMRTGIATLDADEGLDADQLLRRATTAVDWATADRAVTVSD